MKGHVNSSGFPLQIAVENIVNDTTEKHGWRAKYTEHSWKNISTGESGFIDLVLTNPYGTIFLVLECKRVKDTSWIFLIEGTERKNRRHAKSFVFNKSGENIKRFEWLDLTLEPSTPQSQYCVIPGSDQRSRSLIERAAAELVSSTEGLALEDKALSLDSGENLKIYFNVIVTTASLQVCRFDPKTISIENGMVENPIFEEVPYIRFRKQLNPVYEIPVVCAVAGNQDVARAKENTVFVVNSKHLVEFLKAFEIDKNHINTTYLR